MLAIAGWSRRWMSDDGYIHLRVAQQLLDGNGLVYNSGERVEATTSPLWVLLLALTRSVVRVVDLPSLAVFFGIALSVVGLVSAELGAAALSRNRTRGYLVPAGALVVAAFPPFWDYATSGLETGLTFAWLGGSFWFVARRTAGDGKASSRWSLWGGAVLLGLGWLIRPDLVIFTIAFLAALVTCEWRWGWQRCLGVAGIAIACPMTYQVFRMGYYAVLVPNTALAKEAGLAQWSRGWMYLQNLAQPYWLWIPLVALGFLTASCVSDDVTAARRSAVILVVSTVAAALLNAFYYVRVGGDFMHARSLLPALFALTMPIAMVDVHGLGRSRRRPAVLACTAVLLMWGLLCGSALRFNDILEVTLGGEQYRVHATADGDIVDARHALTVVNGRSNPVGPGDFDTFVAGAVPYRASEIRARAEAGDRLLVVALGYERAVEFESTPTLRPAVAATIGAAGVFAYEAGPDVYVVDIHGLGEPLASHLAGLQPAVLGHQKALGLEWIVARFADASATPSPALPVEVDQAREALTCGQLRELLDDIALDLGPRRFVGNVLDSFANTTFRVPREPGDAVAELC